MADQRFSEEEFTEILRRATELQARRLPGARQGTGSGGPGAEPGMSLAEMESIAREVGIEPGLIREAAGLVALEQAATPGTGSDRFLLKGERPGRATEADLVRVVQALRDAAGVHGTLSTGLSGVEWKEGDVVKTIVSADALEESTEIRVAVDANAASVLSHVFPTVSGLLVGMVTGAILEPGFVGGAAILGAGVASGLGAGRLIWKRTLASARARARSLLSAGMAALPSGEGAGPVPHEPRRAPAPGGGGTHPGGDDGGGSTEGGATPSGGSV